MTIETIKLSDINSSSVTRNAQTSESVSVHGVYKAVCYDAEGKIKWEDNFPNTVTTAGKNNLLNIYLGANSVTAVPVTWYLGLIAANGYSAIAAADTAASHAGWIESGAQGASAPGYSQGTRRGVTFAAAASSAKATSNAAIFTISVAGTVKGAFLINNATKAGTGGILYSAGLFTVGDKVVTASDTLNVTYTASA